MAAILNSLIWQHHWELALAPGRLGQSISKITSVPIFMLLYKFAHSLMKIPLSTLTNWLRLPVIKDSNQYHGRVTCAGGWRVAVSNVVDETLTSTVWRLAWPCTNLWAFTTADAARRPLTPVRPTFQSPPHNDSMPWCTQNTLAPYKTASLSYKSRPNTGRVIIYSKIR